MPGGARRAPDRPRGRAAPRRSAPRRGAPVARDGGHRPRARGSARASRTGPTPGPRVSADPRDVTSNLMSLDLVRWGGGRLRVGPWRGDARIAYIAPMADAAPTTADAVRRCCDLLAERGFATAISAALGPAESRGVIEAGSDVAERLHLLAKELHDAPSAPAGPLRRARRLDRADVLAVDSRSFDSFWRLDDNGLRGAIAATRSSRFRVADDGEGVFGYAVSGRAGRRGFLQRLAVDPDRQGHGVGRALAVDGLRWMTRRGAERAMVNTQEHNTNALALYEDLGFRMQPGGLAVLQISLS